jgi:hypothetical protein
VGDDVAHWTCDRKINANEHIRWIEFYPPPPLKNGGYKKVFKIKPENLCMWQFFGEKGGKGLAACMCKEMPVIPVNRLVDTKRIIGKNGGPRRQRPNVINGSKYPRGRLLLS